MTLVAAIAGYLIGSVPSAMWLGWLWGVDLRRDGSGNPGANNARRLGGYTLAALVLIFEITKGLAAVVVGLVMGGEALTMGGEAVTMGGEAVTMGGEAAALAAGLGAVTGNVYNLWYRFEGGKGLGISGGVILGLWPAAFPVVVVTLTLITALTRSTGVGALSTLAVLFAGALFWSRVGADNPWGLSDPTSLLVMVIGIGLIIGPRHWRDARGRLISPAPR